MTFQRYKWLIVKELNQLIKSQQSHKSQTLTFWSILEFKNQELSKHSKLSSLIIKNQQSQENQEKVKKSQKLETKIQTNSRKTFKMKVVRIDEFYNFDNVGWS